jgi:hypothetical protein
MRRNALRRLTVRILAGGTARGEVASREELLRGDLCQQR